jgi:hypothetical protein
MRIFKNKWFSKFARKEGISDEKLIQTVRDVDAGKIDADYGGGVIKQRIARPQEGKSGGYRAIILFRKGDKAFFVYGFAKSVLDNLDRADVRGFKKLAKIMLSVTEQQVENLSEKAEIEEIVQ